MNSMHSVKILFNLLSSAISRRKASQRSSDSSMISSSSSQSYQLKNVDVTINHERSEYKRIYQTLQNLYEMFTSIFSAF